MGLKLSYLKTLLFCISLMFVAGACKKKKAFKEENGQAAEDVRRMQEQNDAIVSDVNIAIMEQSLLRGGSSSQAHVETELCGVSIDSVAIYNGILQLKYSGEWCKGLKKTGIIKVTLTDYPLKKWKNQGCIVKIDFMEYKVSHSDGRSIQFDGTAYLTNESGNTWYEMRYLNASNLIQTHTATNVKVTLDASNTAIFDQNRRLTFNYNSKDSITTCKIEGQGSSNGRDNLENWGQNRNGSDFTTEVVTPVVWKSSCGSTFPVEGEVNINVDEKYFEMKCTFGVDSEGEVSDQNICPYGWKVSWSYKKKTNKIVFAYS